MVDIFDGLVLTPEGTAIRDVLSAHARRHLADALEHFVSISDRPLAEVADRLLCGFFDAYTGIGSERLQALIHDLLLDDEPLLKRK